jgi:tetratricopeptide (TPR) repeat protein
MRCRGALALALALVVTAELICASAARADVALETAKAHFQKGRGYQESGHYDEAIAEYRAAYAARPMAALLFNLGQAYRLKGDTTEALRHYQQFLASSPSGIAADEANNHVAILKLKLDLEQAESARRRAESQAKDLRDREAADVEGIRRAALETTRREMELEIRRQAEQAETLTRRLAEESARARRDEEQAERRKRAAYERAESTGNAARATGYTLIGVGLASLVTAGGVYGGGWKVLSDAGLGSADTCAMGCAMWNARRDEALASARTFQNATWGLIGVGIPLTTIGIGLAVAGVVMKKRALKQAGLGVELSF